MSEESTASPPTQQEKIQPWRVFWPLQDATSTPTTVAAGQLSCASPDHTAKYWYKLERGGLIGEQEKKLALAMEKSFDNKPWYEDREEDWSQLLPADKIRRLEPCWQCGNSGSSCSCGRVFEGG